MTGVTPPTTTAPAPAPAPLAAGWGAPVGDVPAFEDGTTWTPEDLALEQDG